ncbi:MAG: hypothetical protein WA956_05725 [Stenotrophomonas sp.]
MARTPTSVRAYLRSLFLDQGLPVDRITLAHRAVLEDAGIPYRVGQSFDSLLDSLDQEQADALADALRDDEMEEI